MASVRFNISLRNQMKRSIEKLLGRHIRMLSNNMPVKDVDSFVLSLYPPDVLQAIKVLDKQKLQLCYKGTSVYVIPDEDAEYGIELHTENELVLPRESYRYRITASENALMNRPDTPNGREFRDWANKYIQTRLAIQKAVSTFEGFIDRCNTAGQMRAVTPDLINFLDDKLQSKLADTVSKNPPRMPNSMKEKLEIGMQLMAMAVMYPSSYDKRPLDITRVNK